MKYLAESSVNFGAKAKKLFMFGKNIDVMIARFQIKGNNKVS